MAETPEFIIIDTETLQEVYGDNFTIQSASSGIVRIDVAGEQHTHCACWDDGYPCCDCGAVPENPTPV